MSPPAARDRGLDPTPGDDQPTLEGVVGDGSGDRRRHATAGRRAPGRTPAARPPRTPPSAAGSLGTSRQPMNAKPASRDDPLDDRPGTGRRRARSRQETEEDARPPRRSRPSGRIAGDELRIVRSSGRATPAPSLDSPSAPNAPRWASDASPASASGRTRSRERPPASATNPTPHASCSKRAS